MRAWAALLVNSDKAAVEACLSAIEVPVMIASSPAQIACELEARLAHRLASGYNGKLGEAVDQVAARGLKVV